MLIVPAKQAKAIRRNGQKNHPGKFVFHQFHAYTITFDERKKYDSLTDVYNRIGCHNK